MEKKHCKDNFENKSVYKITDLFCIVNASILQKVFVQNSQRRT